MRAKIRYSLAGFCYGVGVAMGASAGIFHLLRGTNQLEAEAWQGFFQLLVGAIFTIGFFVYMVLVNKDDDRPEEKKPPFSY